MADTDEHERFLSMTAKARLTAGMDTGQLWRTIVNAIVPKEPDSD